MISVTLHRNTGAITTNIKYRYPFPANPVHSSTDVAIGNFSNLNLFCDNSVELSCGNDTQSAYEIAVSANYIQIYFHGWNVIGLITDWKYINDNNISFAYKVDAFESAVSSGVIQNMSGLCSRTHLDYTDPQSFVNLNGEPFSISDTQRADPITTEAINNAVNDFEGLTPTASPLTEGRIVFVLTVSPAIIEFIGGIAPMTFPPVSSITPKLIDKSDFNFYGSDSTLHSGGVYRGTPILFMTMADVQYFIKKILAGCGFRTVLSPNGYSTQQATTNKQYITLDNSTAGGGMVYHTDANKENLPMESIRFITSDDIYNLYVIPFNFSTNQAEIFMKNLIYIETMPTLDTFTGFDPEDNSKSKLLSFPYSYKQFVTANGDSEIIIPQTLCQRDGVWANQSKLMFQMKFIGGDTPRLMGKFVPQFADGNPSSSQTNGEWFTIRSYPSILLSINNSYNPQIQRETSQFMRNSAIYASAVGKNQLDNPLKQGYLDGVQGISNDNPNANAYQNFMMGMGSALGNTSHAFSGLTPAFPSNNSSPNNNIPIYQNKAGQDVANANRMENAGNIISPQVQVVSGNDFTTQLNVRPFACYSRGASQSELFGACRYFDQFGQSCNCIINPLDNSGDIFDGKSFVSSYNGKTFYQFEYITIEGAMPAMWKDKIRLLFETGVYLM